MIFLGIIGITLIIIGAMALMIPENEKPKKPWKSPKNHHRNSDPWDKDIFYGTPLQKF